METEINRAFRELPRGEKSRFISDNIHYAKMKAVVEFARDYIFDVLDYCDTEVIAQYLRERDYTVTNQANERTGKD